MNVLEPLRIAGPVLALTLALCAPCDARTVEASTAIRNGCGELSARNAARGVEIMNLRSARDLGLRSGDVVSSVDARPVRTPDQLLAALRADAGRGHVLHVVRGAAAVDVTADHDAWDCFLNPQPPTPPAANGSATEAPQPPPVPGR